MTTDRDALAKLVAIPTATIAANVAGQLPSQLSTSNASQPEQTAQVMELTARLTGTSSPSDAK